MPVFSEENKTCPNWNGLLPLPSYFEVADASNFAYFQWSVVDLVMIFIHG
jgi:hypothetical protein